MMGDGDKKPNKKLELQIYERFSKIVREKFSALDDEETVKKVDSLFNKPEFREEKKLMTEINNRGLTNGVMTGIACFLFLRWSPGVIARYLTRRRAASGEFTQSNGYVNNPFNRPSGYQFNVQSAEETPLSSPNFIIRGIRLGLDIFVSMSIGAYASILLVDKDKVFKQFSEIPLLPGRSLISEELCHDFSVEFKKFSKDTWDENHAALNGVIRGKNEKSCSSFAHLVEGFVANCKKRSVYEQQLRSEQSLGGDEPVVIPFPGVPEDISVTLADLMGDLDDNIEDSSDKYGDGDLYFDHYFEEGKFDDVPNSNEGNLEKPSSSKRY